MIWTRGAAWVVVLHAAIEYAFLLAAVMIRWMVRLLGRDLVTRLAHSAR